MNHKFLAEYAKHIATAMAILALILFIPAGIAQSLGIRITCIVFIALFLIAGIVLLYLGHRAASKILNFFLYDPQTQTKISRYELSAEHVEQGMNRFLSEYVDDAVLLWDEMPQKLRVRLGDEPIFRPLVAYRMLFALSSLSARDLRVVFVGADERTVSYLCRSLADAGDKKMAEFIFELKKNAKDEASRIIGFFMKNRTLFEERMLRFVTENLSAFDLDEAAGG